MKPFSLLSGREKAIELLRWLLVPVAAVVAVFVLILISRVAMPLAMARLPGTPPPPGPDWQRLVMARVFGALISVAFVFAGAKMAPRWRLATALVLAGLWIGYSFLVHVHLPLGPGPTNYWHFAQAVGGALSAVALIGYVERRRGRGLDVPFAKR